MQAMISTLRSRISPDARVAAIEEQLLRLVDPEVELARQELLKPLWYRERVDLMLEGRHTEVLPVNVEVVPALDCNYNCGCCTYRDWKARTREAAGHRLMPSADLARVFDRLEEAGVCGVTITGGGEPFANPDTIDALTYAARRAFATGVFTNGSLLDQQTIERLAGLNLSFIRVSLNTAEASTYQRFHGTADPRALDKVRNNIRLLGQALYGSPTSFGLAVLVDAMNVNALASVAELARDLFAEGARFKLDYLTYRPVVNYGQLHHDLGRQVGNQVVEISLTHRTAAQQILAGLPVEVRFATDCFAAVAKVGENAASAARHCIGHSWCASIAYDGGVYLCSERDGDPAYLLGNILEASLAEIWQAPRRRAVLAALQCYPPACKVRRLEKLLRLLLPDPALDVAQRRELQAFFDVIRSVGEPAKIEFLSW